MNYFRSYASKSIWPPGTVYGSAYGLMEVQPDGSSKPVREGCHADNDGDCGWIGCPQIRDGEPMKSRRHCPLDKGK